MHKMISSLLIAFPIAAAVDFSVAHANENVVGRPPPGPAVAPATGQDPLPRMPIVTDPAQLTQRVRDALGITNDPAAAGEAGHPFTTKSASSDGNIDPVDKYPWRATGKLHMSFGTASYVCTASAIAKGLLVTAAHCVHNYGQGSSGWARAVSFEPARHGDSLPYGTWQAKEWWIPKVYHDGTDNCTVQGVVCQNDIAVVVLEKTAGKFIGEVIGTYGYKSDDYGYFDFLKQKTTQITLLGYPAKNYDGKKMIRTDSLGYQDDPSNVIIGSAQTGGSSGGPWLMNFGTKTSYTGSLPIADDPNQVVATTSWGYTSGKVMVQGASRFGKNAKYTIKSNIQSLIDSACGGNPEYC
jgi:V8-like Glu-specific endopeptidase